LSSAHLKPRPAKVLIAADVIISRTERDTLEVTGLSAAKSRPAG
jgi:hypothetical protein